MTAFQVNLAETPDFDLGGLRVSPGRRQVGSNGKQCELEPKVAQVLVALALARPEVVSRDRLIERCWEGRIVGDDALNRCIVALRHLAKEFSPEPFTIETVSRVGYSLIERPTADNVASRLARRLTALPIVLLLLVLIGAVGGVAAYRFQRAAAAPTSIAVLPFRNLSAGDPYFAEGVGEEILAQLAREPQFRVAGSTSSTQLGANPDIREAARQLNVDYVVEGSVRREGGQVRVNAGLLRASDGVRMWSGTFDGKLDNILQIQNAIGQAVANGLKRKLVIPAQGGGRPINGEAYRLLLNARGLLRSRNPQSGQDAIQLLQQAIRLDPGFAPAWGSLAEALLLDGEGRKPDELIAVLPRAEFAAKRALQLDPNLSKAHAILSTLLGSDTPAAIAHNQRAAELDPQSAEAQMRGAGALEASGQYAKALIRYRRAHELDPLWQIPVRALIDVTAIMGDRAAAERMIRHDFADDPGLVNFGLARVASRFGDFSEAARRWEIASRDSTTRWASASLLSLQDAKYLLTLSPDPPARPALPTVGQFRIGPRVWMASAPSPAEWRFRNRSLGAAVVNTDENIVAAKRMLNAGRAAELAATYDSPSGLLNVRRGERIGVCYLQAAALVSLALRNAGRGAEADRLLRESDQLIRSVYARGRVPIWFEEDAAAIWAMQGKTDAAVAALDRALRRGWVHTGRSDLPRLVDEPVFRLLLGDPRFEAVRGRYDAFYAKERQETARALHIAT